MGPARGKEANKQLAFYITSLGSEMAYSTIHVLAVASFPGCPESDKSKAEAWERGYTSCRSPFVKQNYRVLVTHNSLPCTVVIP